MRHFKENQFLLLARITRPTRATHAIKATSIMVMNLIYNRTKCLCVRIKRITILVNSIYP